MIIIIGPGLILVCVAVVSLIALAHVTAGALIAMVAILAGAMILTAIAVAVMHARVVPAVRPPQRRYRAEVLNRAEEPAWRAEPVSEALTRAQLEAAFRYMASAYGNVPPLADLEAIESPRKDEAS